METNSNRAIHNLTDEDYRLGIIRTSAIYEPYFNELFNEKGIVHEELVKFRFKLVFSKNNPLAKLDDISLGDLERYVEVLHADVFVPSIPLVDVIRDKITSNVRRRLFVFERASAFQLMSENPETFMWMTPLPERIIERFGLVERDCAENTREYKDILSYRDDYTPTDVDRLFIGELKAEIKAAFGKDAE